MISIATAEDLELHIVNFTQAFIQAIVSQKFVPKKPHQKLHHHKTQALSSTANR